MKYQITVTFDATSSSEKSRLLHAINDAFKYESPTVVIKQLENKEQKE